MASLRKVKHIKLNLSKRKAIGGHWSGYEHSLAQ